MLAHSLEKTLNELFQTAQSEGAEYIGVEDLLRGLINDAKCRELLVTLGANIEEIAGDLSAHIESQIPRTAEPPNIEFQPTLGFQRVLQRAVYHVQSSGEREVSGVHILVSLFSERESESARLLAEQGIKREDVLRELGNCDWDDDPENVSLTTGVTGRTVSSGHHIAVTSTSSIETRLSELEEKLDSAISEIRELSVILRQFTERPPPSK